MLSSSLDFALRAPFAVESVSTLFAPQFAQRALTAVLLVALLAAALGPVIVLRDLPFFTHAVGSGAYPALVLGIGGGVSVAAAAPAGALAFAGLLWLLTRRRIDDPRLRDARTGIAVAAALAVGAVLASTVASGRMRLAFPPETLLFGSVLTVDAGSLVLLVAAGAIAVAAAWAFSGRWIAAGFDPALGRQLRTRELDAVLLAVIALAVAGTLPVTGSLMAGAMLVIPASAARLFTSRPASMAVATLFIAISEGVLGLYLSLAFDLPTGATIAAVTGSGFLFTATAVWAVRQLGSRAIRSIALPATVLVAAALLVSGCGGSTKSSGSADQPLKVVATSTQVGDLVKQIGGDAVTVTTLLKPGIDPHDYEPKPSDVRALVDARVIFRSGGDIDGWLAAAIKASNNTQKPVDLSNAVELLPGIAATGAANPNAINAHWYLDPSNLKIAAMRIRDELTKAAPTARETFRANSTAFQDAADMVDGALADCIKKLPPGERSILTGHDDFDYLTAHFGLKIAAQLAATGVSEPSASDVQSAVDSARSKNAKALLTSKGEVGQLAVVVAKKLQLPLLELYADTLDKPGTQAATALGAIEYNTKKIVDAVSGGSIKCEGVTP